MNNSCFKSDHLAAALLAVLAICAGCGQPAVTTNANGNAPIDAAVSTPATAPSTQATAAATPAAPSPATAGGGGSPPANSNTTPNRPATARDPKAPTPQIGSGGNDFYSFTQARAALDADAELKGSHIVIEIREGVATLTGTVAGEAQKQKAERIIRVVQGVKGVKNQLRVSAGAPQQ